MALSKIERRRRIHYRIRKHVNGTAERPRLVVFRSNKQIYVQVVDDEQGVMNLNIAAADGECLVVSQFTLYADTRKGNRPSYINAAPPETARPVYEDFVIRLEKELQRPVRTGVFGANMQVELCNDGPVTIMIDSRQR